MRATVVRRLLATATLPLRRPTNDTSLRSSDIFEYFNSVRPRATARVPSYQLRAHAHGRASPLMLKPTAAAASAAVAALTDATAPAIAEIGGVATVTSAAIMATSTTAKATAVAAASAWQVASPMELHVPTGPPSGMTEADLQSGGFGADAYFLRPDGIGVADGVSGWGGKDKANSQLYARLLMHHVAAEMERASQFFTNETPLELLEFAAAQTASMLGSSTALVATVQDDTLRIGQLGDCGALLIRNGQPIFRSVEQVHWFNYPYQLGSGSRDKATDAIARSLAVVRNDILIAGTDGLFDNLYDEEILAIVRQHIYPWTHNMSTSLPIDPVALAETLVGEAYDASCDRRRHSPFESRAMAEGIMYEGGKQDDITVVVAVVVDSEDSPDRR